MEKIGRQTLNELRQFGKECFGLTPEQREELIQLRFKDNPDFAELFTNALKVLEGRIDRVLDSKFSLGELIFAADDLIFPADYLTEGFYCASREIPVLKVLRSIIDRLRSA